MSELWRARAWLPRSRRPLGYLVRVYLVRPDCELYYEVHGAGPALVFAHGLGGSHASWWQQVPHFCGRYTCVIFSHRGFRPSRGGTERGPAAFVEDLDALLQHLGIAEARLVGQSMGGWTCLGYALARPQAVRALVLASTTGPVTTPTIDALWQAARPGEEAAARRAHPAAGEGMAREQPALHHLYCGLDVLGGADKPALREALMALRMVPAAQLVAVTAPTLCLTGEEDVVVPPAAVAELARLLPRARLERVPAAGHSIYFERAGVFNALVDAFLAEVEG